MKKENSFLSRVWYGFADLYGGGAFLILSILYLVFLTNVVGLPAWLAGTIPLVGKIWDAVTDPIMGNICDRTKSRFGKKRVWFISGSILSCISFIGLFANINAGDIGNYIYALFMYLFFSTAFTIVMVPYNALLPDMVEDYTLRSKYTTIRMIFSAISAILAGLLPNMLKNAFDNFFGHGEGDGYLVSAIIFGLLFLVSILITFFGTWEHDTEVVKFSVKETFSQSLSIYKNKSFRRYLGIFLFGQGSADFVTTLAVYFIIVVLHPGSLEAYNGYYMKIMGAILVSQLLAMFIFNFVMGKTSKKFPNYVGIPLRIVATLMLLFFANAQANIWVIAALSFLAGLGTAASSVTSYAVLADITDIDELVTSERRSGICSGMSTFTRKIAIGIASGLCGLIISLSGYDAAIEGVAADEIYALDFAQKTIDIIKYSYIFIPVVFMILTLVFTYIYRVNKKEFDLVKKEIARRKGEDDSVTTDEEKKILEDITGYKYEDLWKKDNASHLFRK